jgi:hypothetical protein
VDLVNDKVIDRTHHLVSEVKQSSERRAIYDHEQIIIQTVEIQGISSREFLVRGPMELCDRGEAP